MGKACLYFRRLADLDVKVLEDSLPGQWPSPTPVSASSDP